ncbi:MAG: glycosyltransferase family 4 protein [Muribaculaceae bacterium]
MKPKIIRVCTVSNSISFVAGMIPDLTKEYDVCVLSSPGEYWNYLERYGNSVKRLEVTMERHISPIRDLKSLFGLIRVFRKEKPTMVHSMTPKAGLLSMMAAWFCRVPVRVHTFTGLVFPTATGLTQKILILTDRITCACATHIVPEGEGVKNDLINYRITKKPLKVLGHGNVRGIDLAHYNPELPEVQADAAKIRKPGIFTFIFVGRLVRDKGINELVEAFERLNKEIPAIRLILVGRQEPKLDPLKPETIAKIDNNKNIEAVGQQSDVRPWLAASDAFVFPSYREGFPNVVIEAGAMGLPSIVTNINGSREIVINNKNGIIVPPHDTEDLGNAMRDFVTSKKQIERLSSNARIMIASRFEQAYVHQCLKNYYKEILS